MELMDIMSPDIEFHYGKYFSIYQGKLYDNEMKI